MDYQIIARDLTGHFEGEINGIVFRIVEDPGTYWDPPEIYIEYIEGIEFLPNDDEIEDFENTLLERVNKSDYIIPEDVQKRLDDFLEWERNL